MRIDHVILAAADLDAAAVRLEGDYGLRPAGGGRHEGIGTHNRVVPLGGGYLELIAVADAEEAARSPLGRLLARRIAAAAGGLMAWCVAVERLAPVVERLELDEHAIRRQGLTARLAGVEQAMAEPSLPFFIERDAGVGDPGAGGGLGGIEWLELAGDRDRLAAWLGGAELPLRVADGPPAVRAFGVAGRVVS